MPDGSATDGQYLRAWQQEAELEGRYTLWDHPGKVRLLGYLFSAKMGSYKAAVVDYPAGMPDLADTRRYQYSYGLVLNFAQEITKDLGSFLRLGLREPKLRGLPILRCYAKSGNWALAQRDWLEPSKRHSRPG